MRGHGHGPKAKQQQYQGLGSNASGCTASAGKFYTAEPSGSDGSGLPFAVCHTELDPCRIPLLLRAFPFSVLWASRPSPRLSFSTLSRLLVNLGLGTQPVALCVCRFHFYDSMILFYPYHRIPPFQLWFPSLYFVLISLAAQAHMSKYI